MATAVVRLEPDGNGATSNWTAEGVKEKWEEVAQPEMQFGKKLKNGTTEEETQTQKSPTEAEGKARGIKTTTANAIQQFTFSAAQIEAKIPSGATIKRMEFRWFGKPVTTSLRSVLQVGGTPWEEEFKLGGIAEAWHSQAISAPHIAETTRAKLIEKTQFFFEQPASGGESRANVLYLEVEYEEGGGTGVTGKATGALILTGTSKATVNNVVLGAATGPMLLTGTSAATLRAVVEGKAAGTLLLSGTSKGTAAQVVKGSALGTLILTGRSRAFRPTAPKTGSLILIFDE